MKGLNAFIERERGQALTEVAICLFIYLLVMSGIFYFGKGFMVKIRMAMAARYAFDYYAAKFELPSKDDVADRILYGFDRDKFEFGKSFNAPGSGIFDGDSYSDEISESEGSYDDSGSGFDFWGMISGILDRVTITASYKLAGMSLISPEGAEVTIKSDMTGYTDPWLNEVQYKEHGGDWMEGLLGFIFDKIGDLIGSLFSS